MEAKTAFKTYDRLNKHGQTGLKIQSARLQNFYPFKSNILKNIQLDRDMFQKKKKEKKIDHIAFHIGY